MDKLKLDKPVSGRMFFNNVAKMELIELKRRTIELAEKVENANKKLVDTFFVDKWGD